jgi:hypothetical protein
MSDNNTSILNFFFLEIANAISSVENHLFDANTLGEFVEKLGYKTPTAIDAAFSDLKTELTDFIADINKISDDLNNSSVDEMALIEDIIALTVTTAQIINTIKNAADKIETELQTYQDYLNNSGIKDNIAERILDYVLIFYLADNHPRIYGVLTLLGIIEISMQNETEYNPAFYLYEMKWGRMEKLFTDPVKCFEEAYGWGTPDIQFDKLFNALRTFIQGFGWFSFTPNADELEVDGALPAISGEHARNNIFIPIISGVVGGASTGAASFLLDLLIYPDVDPIDPSKHSLVIAPYLEGQASISFQILEQLLLELTAKTVLNGNIGLMLSSSGIGLKFAPNFLDQSVKAQLTLSQEGGFPILKVGNFSMVLNGIACSFEFVFSNASPEFIVKAHMDSLKAGFNSNGADSFIQDFLKDLNFDFSFGIIYSSKNGLSFEGSGKLSKDISLHKQIGPFTIDTIYLAIEPFTTDGAAKISVYASFSLSLGPLFVAVQEMGINGKLKYMDGNSFGNVGFSADFKPPKGIGLSIEASVVKGGGFLLFDDENGRYAGALELTIQDTLQIAAICIITTKMPDGSKGFSLLIIVSVTFVPGIALGMGFFLSGLGGMLGINSTINVDALCEGVRNNALDNILFPEDVVKNINTIIGQIITIFPPKRDQFFIGLMARITWGTPALVYLDFGLMVEFADPFRIAILGVLKLTLPEEDNALLHIQVNFVGILDFKKCWISFDASIINSFILTFTLEGDMALRLSWGSEKGFLMSVGGFHPSFTPPAALKVPPLKRLTLTIYKDNPRLILTSYFAITSNTVQFGAKIDFQFKVSKFSVIGYLTFDALFQFSPFSFIVSISAGLEVKCGNTSILSITLELELSGTTPWHAKGKASFSILFFEIKVSFDKEWGDVNTIEEPTIAILPQSIDAFNADANWISEIPKTKSTLVSLREIPQEPGKIVLLPHGSFKISQTVVPLGITLEKFGTAKPADINKLEISELLIGGEPVSGAGTDESFAPSMFKKMGDQDKLKAASYEKMTGGIKITETDNIELVSRVNRLVEYEIGSSDVFTDAPKQKMTFETGMLKSMAKGGVISQSDLSKNYANQKLKNIGGNINFEEEKYMIVNKIDMGPVPSVDFVPCSYSEAREIMKALLKDKPQLRDKIKVIPAYHMEMA